MKLAFLAFVAEQFPFALRVASGEKLVLALEQVSPKADLRKLGAKIAEALLKGLKAERLHALETIPFVANKERWEAEESRFFAAVDGFFAREHFRAKITKEEKLWILRGMILTRAVDLTLKKIFLSSEIKYKELGFQGKGFRSLGQEAIYAAALKLKRGSHYSQKSQWKGDVVAPLIRDLGVALAFSDNDAASALNAQAGKVGPPTDGRDLHIGDYSKGIWPPAAPLAIASCSVVGIAEAIKNRAEDRVCVSFIGEGGTSLGEWHEAINYASCRRLPVIFCVENNQNALSTVPLKQSAVRVFGDKAIGYGIGHVTIDGTDPDAVASAFAWGAERARDGKGPVLIELVSMRMCGHAHHDDMLYLGHEPAPSFDYPTPSKTGYVDAQKYAQWAKKDPIATYARRLIAAKICTANEVEKFKLAAKSQCDEALEEIKARPWPEPQNIVIASFAGQSRLSSYEKNGLLHSVRNDEQGGEEVAPAFSKDGSTYMEAIAQAVYEQMQNDSRVVLLGEDVEPPYGNAFMMFRAAPKKLWPRFINTPIAENAIVGALVGMAAEGMRPIGEMQFNDFAASAFNQLVNNAAKLRYRTNIAASFVLRMPWGGLRRAGPYHSQDTIPWFHRAFGFKIVAPSTPHDARALFHAAMNESDPVLFYEHIGLYRDPSIRQQLSAEVPNITLGKAALRKEGSDLTLISYGAFVHRVLSVAHRLEQECSVNCDVIDLRSLVPLDFETVAASIAKTGRVLLVGEDSRTGSYLESLASKIGEELFEALDAPVRVIGAQDTPIPYSPSLEDAFLPSHEHVFTIARDLANW